MSGNTANIQQLYHSAINAYQHSDTLKAKQYIEDLLAQDNQHADAWHLKAYLCFIENKVPEAVHAIMQAIANDGSNADYYNSLSVFCRKLGDYTSAISYAQKALELSPSHYDAGRNLGILFRETHRFRQAVIYLEKACEARSDDIEGLNLLGCCYRELREHDAAIRCFNKALTKAPKNIKLLENLGVCYQQIGDIPKARKFYQKAIKCDASFATGYFLLANSKRYQNVQNSEVPQIESLLSQTAINQEDKATLHFALGKIFDDCQQYDKAFQHYQIANQTLSISFEMKPVERSVRTIQRIFTPAFYEARNEFGLDTKQPIFIVGMMRSGTTLVEQFLSNHKDIEGAGELTKIGELIKAIPNKLGSYPENIQQLQHEHVLAMAEAYLKELQLVGNNAERIVDKMPANFQYLGVISILFPKAKIIWCQRDPRDICLSCYFTHFRERTAYAYDLNTLGHYYVEFYKLMQYWQQVLPNPIHIAQYESIVENPEHEIKSLIEFVDMPWDQKCLKQAKSNRFVRTASSWQVRQPIYKTSKQRWKNYESYIGELTEILSALKT